MTEFGITGPIPADVLGTLLAACDKAWEGTRVVASYPGESARVSIDDDARPGHDPDVTAMEVLSLGPEGLRLAQPQFVMDYLLAMLAAMTAEFPDFENYLEQRLRDPDTGEDFVLTIRRVTGKTPHELRLAAEEKLAEITTKE